MSIDLNKCASLKKEFEAFFERIHLRLDNKNYQLTDNLTDFRKMFMDKKGVVINTIHGVKGEEYDVVIAFGLLKSKIPFLHTPVEIRDNVANRLLYVMASRCKKDLIMFSESGRTFKNGYHYQVDEPFSYLRIAVKK